MSGGSTTSEAVYRMVVHALAGHQMRGTLVDIGCGTGRLFALAGSCYNRYVGVDIDRYDEFPHGAEFVRADLNSGLVPLPDRFAQMVVSVETIEHLENPRALVREMARLARVGGLVVVTTPNQLSLLSLLTLMVKGQFNQFQETPGSYPAHITALLEVDLVRIARECGLKDIKITYSDDGRMPLTGRHWPAFLKGRRFSDNLMLTAVKAA
jgi:SAM-dependent methyltransferase